MDRPKSNPKIVNRFIRLPKQLDDFLKKEAARIQTERGSRVTAQDVIKEILNRERIFGNENK